MNVLILSINKYPDGDAGALRQHTFAKLFNNIGAKVIVIGMGDSTNLQIKTYDGIEYISFRNTKNNIINRIENLLKYKSNLMRYLKNCKLNFDIIFLVDIPFSALFFIKNLAKKNDSFLIHDSIEWYSPEQFKYGKLSIQYILKDLYNKYWIDNQFNIIAISKYLEKHFINKGCHTIRIPVIMDIEKISHKKNINENKLTLVYAGVPAKKDYLKEIIEGINELTDNELNKIEFRIIGATKEQVLSTLKISHVVIQRLNNIIIYKGRLSHADVLNNLEEADFTVLLRSPIQRYAKAGFPTKVVESLASGTPVICNITSDLSDYLIDTKNSIIVENCSARAFSKAIRRSMDLTFEQRKIMYENARKCAEENFDYRIYKQTILSLINVKKGGVINESI